MKIFYLLVFLFLATISVKAQITVRTDAGRPALFTGALPAWGTATEDYQGMNLKGGSPFFQDVWAQGKIITPDKQVYTSSNVKLDLLANHVHYLDSAGREWIINFPVNELLLDQPGRNASAHFIHGSMLPTPRPGWYQVLVNDTVSLVKRWIKSVEQRVPYGGGPESWMLTNVSYMAYFYYREYEIKSPADFARVIPAMGVQIEQEAKHLERHLTIEEKLKRMASFCNTLPGLKRF
jgi:hypothetical protein